ncbi:hypothetical protein FRC07_009224, partial [Ceratobasidium sp. 392]
RPNNFIAPSDDQLLSRPAKYEWSIWSSDNGINWKIRVPAVDLYWYIPDGAGNQSQ